MLRISCLHSWSCKRMIFDVNIDLITHIYLTYLTAKFISKTARLSLFQFFIVDSWFFVVVFFLNFVDKKRIPFKWHYILHARSIYEIIFTVFFHLHDVFLANASFLLANIFNLYTANTSDERFLRKIIWFMENGNFFFMLLKEERAKEKSTNL